MHCAPVVLQPLDAQKLIWRIGVGRNENVNVGSVLVLIVQEVCRALVHGDETMTESCCCLGVELTPRATVETEMRQRQRAGENNARAL